MIPQEKIVGLHIGEEQVTAIQCIQSRNGSHVIKRAGYETFSPNASDIQIAKTIRTLWRKARFTSYSVAVCVDSRSLLLKFFNYPSLTEDELEAALKLDAEETLQLDPKDLYLDWHYPPASGFGTEGFMVAAPRLEVERFFTLIRKASLYPVILDTGCTALANTFLATEGIFPSSNPVCLLYASGQTLDQSILLDQDRLYPYRIFSRASNWEEASDYLLRGLEDNFRHFQYKLRQPPVQHIIFSGSTPEQASFLERLQDRFALPVHMWNPCEHMNIKSTKLNRFLTDPEGPGPRFALSLGMALR